MSLGARPRTLQRRNCQLQSLVLQRNTEDSVRSKSPNFVAITRPTIYHTRIVNATALGSCAGADVFRPKPLESQQAEARLMGYPLATNELGLQ